MTVVEDYQRRFRHGAGVRRAGTARARRGSRRRTQATWTPSPSPSGWAASPTPLKDVVGTTGFGIGSAGLPAYNLLVEGHTQALENDVVLTMKQGNVAAPSRVVDDEEAAASSSSTTATAPPCRSAPCRRTPTRGSAGPRSTAPATSSRSSRRTRRTWTGATLSEPDELEPVLEQLGRATAKVHCVSDEDSEDTPLVDFQTEDAVAEAVGDRWTSCRRPDEFAHDYAERARKDHHLFVAAFRADEIPGVTADRLTSPACRGGRSPGRTGVRVASTADRPDQRSPQTRPAPQVMSGVGSRFGHVTKKTTRSSSPGTAAMAPSADRDKALDTALAQIDRAVRQGLGHAPRRRRPGARSR